MFSKKNEDLTLHMPRGYKFEFKTAGLNIESSTLQSVRLARLTWFLFKDNTLVEQGQRTIPMDAKHPEVEMFLYGRRRALKHAKKVRDEETFLFADLTKTYEVPQSMVINKHLVAAYDPQ